MTLLISSAPSVPVAFGRSRRRRVAVVAGLRRRGPVPLVARRRDRAGPHPRERRREARLGVDEEARAERDLLAFREAREDLPRPVPLLPDRDLARLEEPLPFRDEDDLPRAAVEDGVRGDLQRRSRRALEDDVGVHLRLKLLSRVRELEPHLRRPRLLLERRVDVRHPPAPLAAGPVGERHPGRLADGDARQLRLVDVGEDPDRGEVDDVEEGVGRHHLHPVEVVMANRARDN